MIDEEELYPQPSIENAEEEDVEEPDELEEEEEVQVAGEVGGVIRVPPRIEWKVANTHFKVELTVCAETMDEAKDATLELFRESLKAIRVWYGAGLK